MQKTVSVLHIFLVRTRRVFVHLPGHYINFWNTKHVGLARPTSPAKHNSEILLVVANMY